MIRRIGYLFAAATIGPRIAPAAAGTLFIVAASLLPLTFIVALIAKRPPLSQVFFANLALLVVSAIVASALG